MILFDVELDEDDERKIVITSMRSVIDSMDERDKDQVPDWERIVNACKCVIEFYSGPGEHCGTENA